jgi:hypothetical protein
VRGRVISELLQHVLATHANVVVEQLGALSKGSSLQVRLGAGLITTFIGVHGVHVGLSDLR